MSKLIKLTRPDRVPVWIMASAVERISAAVPGDGPAAARATVNVGGVTQLVEQAGG